jgi:hypothetical protein
MPTSAVVAALSLSVTAYFTAESPIRNLLAAGAAASFGIPAWTLIFMLPVNSELTARLKATAVKPMEPREEQRVLDLLDKWRAMHRVRMVLGTIALSASLVGLLATDRVIWYVLLRATNASVDFSVESTRIAAMDRYEEKEKESETAVWPC